QPALGDADARQTEAKTGVLRGERERVLGAFSRLAEFSELQRQVGALAEQIEVVRVPLEIALQAPEARLQVRRSRRRHLAAALRPIVAPTRPRRNFEPPWRPRAAARARACGSARHAPSSRPGCRRSRRTGNGSCS